jgi:hypothetical protein
LECLYFLQKQVVNLVSVLEQERARELVLVQLLVSVLEELLVKVLARKLGLEQLLELARELVQVLA